MKFSELELLPDLLAVVEELGFSEPTAIQKRSLPLLLKGKDLVGQSQTGSGKTLAFALPLLQKVNLEEREIQALVLCPTRELCTQVAREIRRLGRKLKGLQVLILAGGQPLRPQREAIERGVHIVVGTPGRILDHLGRGHLHFSRLQTLVLDEADRMLDMGFGEDVAQVLAATPGTRQTLMFSATFPAAIKNLSRRFQLSPVHIQIEAAPDSAQPIRQLVLAAETDEKPKLLLRVLKKTEGSALVFCNQKAAVSELVLEMERQGLSSAALHGDLEQRDRDRVLAMFRNGTTKVLIATDVAARGLDIEGLDLVVNYDVPHEADVYTHRIGRTGRAGQAGLALSLGTQVERSRLREFEMASGFKIEKVDLHSLPGKKAGESVGEMQTLSIFGGRKDKLRPGDILGALTGEAGGLKAEAVGKIEILDTTSYVAVAKSVADVALARLKSGRIKGRKFMVKRL